MRSSLTFLGGVLAAIMLVSGAGAATYYVDAAAGPGGDGSPGSPFQTVQQGINASGDTDTVVVMPGTYAENISFLGKAITVTSSNPGDPGTVAATIIDGGAAGTVVTFAGGEGSDSVLCGLTIRNGRAEDTSSTHGGGIQIDAASPVILDNVITANYTKSDGGGIAVVNQASPTIQGNTISGNAAEGWGGGIFVYGDASDPENVLLATPLIWMNRITGNSTLWDGGGIACFDACSAFIKSNVVDNNSSGMDGGGIFVGSDVVATVENNTLADNDALGSSIEDAEQGTLVRTGRGGGLACWFSGAATCDSSILWGNAAKDGAGNQMALDGTSSLTMLYGQIMGGQAAVYVGADATLTWGAGNNAGDPVFAPAAGDYHLQALAGRYDPATGTWVQDMNYSPCIDTGNPALSYDLEPMPNGMRVNRGGYGNTPEASMAGIPYTLSLSKDYGWTYQNTPERTADRHRVVLTIQVHDDWNGNTGYEVTVGKISGSGDVTAQPTANPLVWHLVGSRRGVGGYGPVELQVTVAGNVGGIGISTTSLTVVQLADIDQSTFINAMDKVPMNLRLNSMPTPGYTDRNFDLDGDGYINALDKVIINMILNGVTVP